MTDVSTGGRFREIYYWDSFWIVEGLIESQLFNIANDTLQNFMDQLDQFGFIPNGGRIYCTSFFFNRKETKTLYCTRLEQIPTTLVHPGSFIYSAL